MDAVQASTKKLDRMIEDLVAIRKLKDIIKARFSDLPMQMLHQN